MSQIWLAKNGSTVPIYRINGAIKPGCGQLEEFVFFGCCRVGNLSGTGTGNPLVQSMGTTDRYQFLPLVLLPWKKR